MILIVGTSVGLATSFTSESSNLTFETMKEEELSNLQDISTDKALLVTEYLKGVETDIKMAWEFATELFNGRINSTPIESYWADPAIDPRIPPGPMVDDYYGFGPASWEVSTIFVPEVDNPQEFATLPISVKQMINISSSLDFIFKALHSSNPNYIWIYMGFEEAGLFRQLPYNDMSWARDGGYYDSRVQDWYKKAVDAKGLNIFLDRDPESGLVLTSSMPVYFDNGTLVGVISVDLPLGAVEEAILSGKVLENGYSYLIDHEGRVLVHPRLVDEPELFGSQIGALEEVENDLDFASIILNATSGKEGIHDYIKRGEKWYAAYSPSFRGKFSVLVVVPEADILQPAVKLKNRILSELAIGLGIFLLISLALSGGIAFVTTKLSDKIVEPVTELTEVCKRITQGDLSRDLRGDGGGSQEISLLYTTFEGLVTTLRFGNEEYYAGNLDRAMSNYQRALELFKTLKNEKGIGICLNNIGNIHKARGNLKDANAAYKSSIEIARKLLAETSEEAEKVDLTVSLASRYNNLGMLYFDIEEYDKAEGYVLQALDLDKSIDNAKGMATRYGNLATIKIAKGEFEEARKFLEEEKDIAEALANSRLLLYSNYNYGQFYRSIGQLEEAIDLFLDTAANAEDLDIRIALSCLKSLSEIYKERGNKKLAKEIDVKLKKLAGSRKMRFVTFVLDMSGSMAGKKLKAARDGIRKIFKNQVAENDLVRIIVFSRTAREYLSPMKKKGNEKEILLAINKLNRAAGATAFYDALGDAMTGLDDMTRDNWIVALTDGEDNSSKRYSIDDLKGLAGTILGVNLVIIGVGQLQNRKDLEELCSLTDKGRYIDVSSGVAEAISVAFEEISSMMTAVDVEGFVPDN